VGAALLCTIVTLGACEQPEEPRPPVIEVAYLLDRVNGAAPPARVCEQDAIEQRLRFESIALADDGSYGRLQEIQIDDGTPIQQEERGEFERTAETILLRNANAVVTTLTLLDSAGAFVRRIHPCGDTLRYASVPIVE
jgi:hypothetical protein